MEAIVLAGGLGTRLRPLVSDVPKPMAPVKGRPFLELLLEYWIGQGVRRFVLSVGYLAERISGHFGARWGGAEIDYATEPQALGTGGGLLLAAARTTATDIVVINGDTYFAVPLKDFRAFHEESKADWTLALFRTNDGKRYQGLSVDAEGKVGAMSGDLSNGGVYIMSSSRLRQLPWQAGQRLSLESDLLPHALRNGWRVYGREFDRPFVDIGVPQDYRGAGAIIQ
ncbi:MAG: sugar phosphate nucleotidyltransferase [Betaproteobacteria bacterium]